MITKMSESSTKKPAESSTKQQGEKIQEAVKWGGLEREENEKRGTSRGAKGFFFYIDI